MRLVSLEGASNVVVLRPASQQAVASAARAADEGPFFIPPDVCPKCIAVRRPTSAEDESCGACGLFFSSFDEEAVLPEPWLRDAWLALLRDWANQTHHVHLRQQAQQADALAAIGRLYRLRLAVVPDDSMAKAGCADVVRLAVVPLSAPSSKVDRATQRSKQFPWVIAIALIMVVAVAALLLT